MGTYRVNLLPHFKKQVHPLGSKYERINEALIRFFINLPPCARLENEIYKGRIDLEEISPSSPAGFWADIYFLLEEDTIIPVAFNHSALKENLSRKDILDKLEITLGELCVDK